MFFCLFISRDERNNKKMPPLRNKKGRFATKGILNRHEKGLINGKNNRGRIACKSRDNNLKPKTSAAGELNITSNNAPGHNTREKSVISVEKTQAVQKVEVNPVVGDRIVNLQHIDKQLFCCSCKTRLDLFGNIRKETIKSLGSLWFVSCKNCNEITPIETTKRYKSLVSGRCHFEVNVKAVLGKCLQELFMSRFLKHNFDL